MKKKEDVNYMIESSAPQKEHQNDFIHSFIHFIYTQLHD